MRIYIAAVAAVAAVAAGAAGATSYNSQKLEYLYCEGFECFLNHVTSERKKIDIINVINNWRIRIIERRKKL